MFEQFFGQEALSPEMHQALISFSTWLLPILFAVTLHEAAHGYVAWRLGDDTAKREGRVSFNPLRHIDLVGTIILPGLLLLSGSRFLFGWAKPVPVNPFNLPNPRRDMMFVAAAGPFINLLMAFVAFILMHGVSSLPVSPTAQDWFQANLENAALINLVLAVLICCLFHRSTEGGWLPDFYRPAQRRRLLGLNLLEFLLS